MTYGADEKYEQLDSAKAARLQDAMTNTPTPEAVAELCRKLRAIANADGPGDDDIQRDTPAAATMLESLSRALAERDAEVARIEAKLVRVCNEHAERKRGFTRALIAAERIASDNAEQYSVMSKVAREALAELAAARKVPREPTEAMIKAGTDALRRSDRGQLECWYAMYDAAQSAPMQAEEGG